MNVLLIKPYLPANAYHKKIVPLGIAYIASYLRQHCPEINVRILDAQVSNPTLSGVMKAVTADHYDLIGLSYWTLQAPAAYAISMAIKELDKDILLVHGGVHPTLAPAEAAEFADLCVLHEGEESFTEIVRRLEDRQPLNDVPGVAYLKDGCLVKTTPRPFIPELDRLPFPAWDLLQIEKYDTPFHLGGGRRMPIIGSRGCPYCCTFCASPSLWERTVRWRSPESVVAEMKEVVARYGIDQFHFWDDNLMMNKEFVAGLASGIIRERLNVRWIGLTRASHINRNPELLPMMRQAGCVGIEIGIESANPETYEKVMKGEELSDMEMALAHQRNAGMKPLCTFMTFNPGETITSYYLQIKFLQKMIPEANEYAAFEQIYPTAFGQFSTPHVGTQFRRDAAQMGLVLSNDNGELFHHTVNFIPNSLLDDVPERTEGARLTADHWIACLKSLNTLWLYLRPQLNLRQRMRQVEEYLRYIAYFFHSCDGTSDVRQIAGEAAEHFNISFKKSVIFAALNAVALSQLGLIRSGIHHLNVTVKPIPGKGLNSMKLKIQFYLLRYLGKYVV